MKVYRSCDTYCNVLMPLCLYVPYPMMWAIMDFLSSLSLAFSNSATSWYLTPLSPIHSFKFAIQSDRFLPLLLFPSIFPVSDAYNSKKSIWNCLKLQMFEGPCVNYNMCKNHVDISSLTLLPSWLDLTTFFLNAYKQFDCVCFQCSEHIQMAV